MKRHWIGYALAMAVAMAAGTAAAGEAPAAQVKQSAGNAAKARAEVTLYVMPECGYCEKARQLLTQRGVTWKERDIADSADAKRDFAANGGVGTPLIVIGDDVIRGFDAARVEASLNARGLVAK